MLLQVSSRLQVVERDTFSTPVLTLISSLPGSHAQKSSGDEIERDKLAGEIRANAPRLGERAFRVLILSRLRVAWSISLSRAQCISLARSSLSEN